MLDALRRHAKGWVAGLFIGLLILSFGIWGIADIFKGGGDTTIARVGRVKIDQSEFDRLFRQQVDALRENFGTGFDAQTARTMGLDRRILDGLIRRTAMDSGTRDLGLTMPDDLIAQSIRGNSVFHDRSNVFSAAIFQEWLRRNEMSESMLVDGIRGDATRQQLIETIAGGISLPTLFTDPLLRYSGEKRVAHYAIIPPEAVGTIPAPSESEQHAYFEAHKQNYTAPETRDFTYVSLSPADIAPSIAISEEDMRQQFQFQKDTYGTPERRTLEQLAFDSEEAAKKAQERVTSGTNFADIAREQGRAPSDMKLADKSRGDLVALGEKVADAAFTLTPDQTSAPVQGRFGWLLLRLVSIQPGKEAQFDEVRAKIRDDIARERAGDRISDLANQLEDARASGATLEEAAKAAGAKAVTLKGVDSEGKDATGATIAGLSPDLLSQAFRDEIGQDADITPASDGSFFVVRVDSVTPSGPRSFESVREQVSQDYIKAERKKRLEKIAANLSAEAKSGKSFEGLLQNLKLVPQKSEPITREGIDEFSHDVTDKLFAAKQDEVVFGPPNSGEGLMVMQVAAIIPPDPEADRATLSKMRDGLSESLSGELVRKYTDALEEELGVVIEQDAFERDDQG